MKISSLNLNKIDILIIIFIIIISILFFYNKKYEKFEDTTGITDPTTLRQVNKIIEKIKISNDLLIDNFELFKSKLTTVKCTLSIYENKKTLTGTELFQPYFQLQEILNKLRINVYATLDDINLLMANPDSKLVLPQYAKIRIFYDKITNLIFKIFVFNNDIKNFYIKLTDEEKNKFDSFKDLIEENLNNKIIGNVLNQYIKNDIIPLINDDLELISPFESAEYVASQSGQYIASQSGSAQYIASQSGSAQYIASLSGSAQYIASLSANAEDEEV